MADAAVAMDTIQHVLVVARVGSDFTHQLIMTKHTIFLQNSPILGLDSDWLMKILQSKPFGMPEAILHFG